MFYYSPKILLSSNQASNLHPFHLKMQSSIKALYRRLVYLDFYFLSIIFIILFSLIQSSDLSELSFIALGVFLNYAASKFRWTNIKNICS